MRGKTEQRLALVILLTAMIPLAMSAMLASSLFNHVSSLLILPEVSAQLEKVDDFYKSYIHVVKEDMKHQADAISGDELLRDAAKAKRAPEMEARLAALFHQYPELVSLTVEDTEGQRLASKDRGRPVDDTKERTLEVRRPLARGDDAPMLVAAFAFDRKYEKDLEEAAFVQQKYENLKNERDRLYRDFFRIFAALLGATFVVTVVLGFLLARGVTRRINRLANAINRVAAGDLAVRVPVTGSDELTELARVFNRMLGDMQQSRARIEYLQRIGAWQEMAKRLAHEIKNPLTPIQLAVQECHRKYEGDDSRYRALLDTTREIVEEEVGTLRRLVGNFSNFARLPHVELTEADLRDFLRECKEQLGHLEEEEDGGPLQGADVEVTWSIPEGPLRAAFDRQMFRRVLVNLVRNAVQAVRDGNPGGRGKVTVSARRDDEGAAIEVADDGPGVPDESRERVFDPYFTTKADGTGLGLAIVKKIVVEHGGAIEVESSRELGGAAFVIRLPGPHSLAIAAARGAPSAPPSKRAIA